MAKKSLFKKKKIINNKKNYIIILCIIIITFIIFFYYFPKHSYFVIPEFKSTYYIIPEDKGGEKIINQDKKGLHLANPLNNKLKISKDPSLKFSIQISTNHNYNVIKKKMNSMITLYNETFYSNDLYVAVLKHNFGIDFYLLYKNFNSRNDALEYCNKYVYFLDNCIIVNVENLE